MTLDNVEDDALELVDVADEPEANEEAPETEENPEQSDEFVVSFEDDAPEEAVEDTPLIKQLRDLTRDQARRLKEYEKAEQKAKPIELGPKPTYESCGYDEEAYEQALDAWKAQEAKVKAQQGEQRAEQEKTQARGREIVAKYEDRIRALPVKDFNAAQETVRDKIGSDRLGFIVAGADEPEKLVYALAKNPKRLDALAAIDIPARFAFVASKLEKEMKVATRKAPEPEGVVRGAAPLSASADKHLEKLEAKAARTGDRSEVIAYKAKQKAK